MIVLMAGLPGTGKSTLARALASRLSGTILSKDVIRHVLFPPRNVEYSTEQDDFVMQVMLEVAGWILAKDPGRIVFLDGRTFSRRYQIEQVIEAAQKREQPWHILECVCPEETASGSKHRRTRASTPRATGIFGSTSRSKPASS